MVVSMIITAKAGEVSESIEKVLTSAVGDLIQHDASVH